MAFTPFVETDQPTMEAFNEKFQECILEAVGQSPKVETGSYIGTGKYGKSNPNTLTFEFDPKIVIICGTYTGTHQCFPFLIMQNPLTYQAYFNNNGSQYPIYVTWSEKTMSWYTTGSGVVAKPQFNVSGETYYYVAIG